MRISHITFEGSPDEFDELPDSFRALLAPAGSSATAPIARPTGDTDDLHAHIRSRARSSATGDLVGRFADEVLSWGGVQDHIGESKNTPDGKTHYFSLLRVGSGLGALAYVHPRTGKVEFRLAPTHANGMAHARALNRKETNNYQVAVFLTGEEAFREAVELARTAIAEMEEF